MKLDSEQLSSFKELYFKKFGIELSDQEALNKAMKLLKIVEMTSLPMNINHFNAVQKRRKELTNYYGKN